MEQRILDAETSGYQHWHKQIEEPKIMANNAQMTEACDKMHSAQEAVAALYKRWEALEGKLNG